MSHTQSNRILMEPEFVTPRPQPRMKVAHNNQNIEPRYQEKVDLLTGRLNDDITNHIIDNPIMLSDAYTIYGRLLDEVGDVNKSLRKKKIKKFQSEIYDLMKKLGSMLIRSENILEIK